MLFRSTPLSPVQSTAARAPPAHFAADRLPSSTIFRRSHRATGRVSRASWMSADRPVRSPLRQRPPEHESCLAGVRPRLWLLPQGSAQGRLHGDRAAVHHRRLGHPWMVRSSPSAVRFEALASQVDGELEARTGGNLARRAVRHWCQELPEPSSSGRLTIAPPSTGTSSLRT